MFRFSGRPGRRRLVLPALATTAVFLGGLAVTAMPASAHVRSPAVARPAAIPPPVVVGTFFLKNHSTRRCADDSKLGLRTFTCNHRNFQDWRVIALNDAHTIVMLQNVNTRRCLAQLAGQRLKTSPCNRAVNGQLWASSTWRVGSVLFAWFQQATGRGCLDDNNVKNEGFRTAACARDIRDTDQHQVWQLD